MKIEQSFQLSFIGDPVIHLITKEDLDYYWLQFIDLQCNMENTTITADFLYIIEEE